MQLLFSSHCTCYFTSSASGINFMQCVYWQGAPSDYTSALQVRCAQGLPRSPFSTDPWWETVPIPDLHGSLGEAAMDKPDCAGRGYQLVETSSHAQGWWQPLGLRFQGHASGVSHADKNHAGLPDTWDVRTSGSQEPACAKKQEPK